MTFDETRRREGNLLTETLREDRVTHRRDDVRRACVRRRDAGTEGVRRNTPRHRDAPWWRQYLPPTAALSKVDSPDLIA